MVIYIYIQELKFKVSLIIQNKNSLIILRNEVFLQNFDF